MNQQKIEQWYLAYGKDADVYESFSRFEDAGHKAIRSLLKKADFRNKIVLEIGCGSGKYTGEVAKLSKKYYALDNSESLLQIAKAKSKGIQNIEFIHSSAAEIPLSDNSVDVMFASWAFPPYDAIDGSVKEVDGVIKSGGHIWLIGNNPDGEFMDMRGNEEKQSEKEGMGWYKDNGYELVQVVNSNFDFPTIDEAKRVLGFIFGDKAMQYLKKNPNPKLKHRIAILHRVVEK